MQEKAGEMGHSTLQMRKGAMYMMGYERKIWNLGRARGDIQKTA